MDVYTQIYVLMIIKWMSMHKYMFLWWLNGCLYTNICSYDYMFLWLLNGCLYTNICSYDD